MPNYDVDTEPELTTSVLTRERHVAAGSHAKALAATFGALRRFMT